jgi:hypothetical protein
VRLISQEIDMKRRLQLNRETVRDLTTHDLKLAQGGAKAPCDTTGHGTECLSCWPDPP